jgi:hypothetical protein
MRFSSASREASMLRREKAVARASKGRSPSRPLEKINYCAKFSAAAVVAVY